MSKVERIRAHPAFRQLATERARLGVSLAVVMAAAYFAFILTVAFRPALLGVPLHGGTVITWGILVGTALLSLGFLLTAIYVVCANARFDPLSQRLQEDVR